MKPDGGLVVQKWTVRDEYAAKAMTGILTGLGVSGDANAVVECAFKIADIALEYRHRS